MVTWHQLAIIGVCFLGVGGVLGGIAWFISTLDFSH